ncbi:MAG: hypothetical protein NT062_24625 [Proteobacteria bacterium]|nr:hypothetical protein [Pseudomonadota bacterium]
MAAPKPDLRRWIFAGIDVLLVVLYAGVIWKIIPNRMLSAQIHLWLLPVAMAMLAGGLIAGGKRGWWVGVAGGSLLLATSFLLIARILISAAFLAGVYGAFGRAASSFAVIAVLLVIELVVLFPLFQVRYLLSRAGRRTFDRAA